MGAHAVPDTVSLAALYAICDEKLLQTLPAERRAALALFLSEMLQCVPSLEDETRLKRWTAAASAIAALLSAPTQPDLQEKVRG